ncbi:MAG: hypothetical protein MZV64_28195 [Ignavibacteriales bacterium]|nr:hypothetical protein [Ignavibacteriales bacterium]
MRGTAAASVGRVARSLVRAAARAAARRSAPRRPGPTRPRTRRVRRRPASRSSSGWPTNSTGMPAVAIDRRLEREDDQRAVDQPLEHAQPPRTPGPDLRAHVVHDGDAERDAASRRA